MSSRESTLGLPIFIDYRPSRRLFAGLTIIHIGAIICLLGAAVPFWLKCLTAVGMITAYSGYFRSYHEANNAPHPLQLMLTAEDEWRLIKPDGKGETLKLLPGAFVHPYLIVIRFHTDAKRRYVFALTTENVDPDRLRRLRVRLRFRKEVTQV
ncbi:MAG: protein YgfX [Gammaproteobacteria bacterium]